MKKIYLILILFVLIANTTMAKTLMNHEIIVDVTKQGSANVVERFVFGLEGDEIKQFDDISATRTNNLETWHEFDNRINQYVLGNTSGIKISTTKINQGQFGYEIKLEYSIKNFAKKVDTEGRYQIYEINATSFLLYKNGTFSLPESTDLTISLDSNIKPEDIIAISPTPWTTINKQSFKWISGTYTKTFYIKYKIEASISEGLTINNLLNFFIRKPVYGTSLIIILIISIIYRKHISELIAESFSGEEGITMPRRIKKRQEIKQY